MATQPTTLPESSDEFRPVLPPREAAESPQLVMLTKEQLAARREHDLRVLESLRSITDETDTEELWDEVLRNLGVDPATGGPLEP